MTSRLSLTDLAATRRGTHVRRVGLLDPAEAYAFLEEVLGAEELASLRVQAAAMGSGEVIDVARAALSVVAEGGKGSPDIR